MIVNIKDNMRILYIAMCAIDISSEMELKLF